MKRIIAAAIAIVGALLLFTPRGEAHGTITSKFTYHADLYPIFLNKCGQCHVADGVAPMSLLAYQDAFPWSESLRTELLDLGDVRPNDFIRAAHHDLSAAELNIVLDWAVGGFPEGQTVSLPPPVSLKKDWTRQPDLALPIAEPYQMGADVAEATQEFVLPVTLTAPRAITAVDVLPGAAAIVRETVISLKSGGGPAKTIATWTPRQKPGPFTVTPAVPIAPGSELVARIHYKKTWKYEGEAVTDRSTIGIYFGK